MKRTLCVLVVCTLAQGIWAAPKHHKTNSVPVVDTNAPAAAPVDPAVQMQEYQKQFVPADPWRVLNGKTNYAKGGDWCQFEGRVVRVFPSGIELQGWFGEPLLYMLPGKITNELFFLTGFPRPVAVGQVLSRTDRLVAIKAGTTPAGNLPNLDYGTVWAPVLTDEQKAKAAQAKTDAGSKVLAWHQELADKGDPYGEYKMGLHYLNGDGVAKDLQKARDLFSKAAAQGNQDAAAELAKLPAN
jgi:Sel1 repeat